jgi:hypothetical protein
MKKTGIILPQCLKEDWAKTNNHSNLNPPETEERMKYFTCCAEIPA